MKHFQRSCNLIELLKHLFLFQGVSDNDLKCLISKITFSEERFERGATIYSPTNFTEKIGFIIDGKCEVRKVHPDSTYTPINVLKKHDSFGIISVLNDTPEFPTHIVALKDSAALFISKSDFLLLLSFPIVSLNVCKFLAKKVVFLNSKISTFSCSDVEEKLANHILIVSNETESNSFIFNRKRTAELLNTGRASLYRALDSLKQDGIITYDSKKIYIVDREGLERKTK